MVLGYFLLAAFGFGFVIFIHELGHFTFAKMAGVKVEVFSIGFGPKILSWRWGETEWTLSLLPFGGYVRMLGQDDDPKAQDATAATRVDPRSYLAKPARWQALILLGGVLFNFISSYLILLVLAFGGVWPGLDPVVAGVRPTLIDYQGKEHQSPAQRMGLRVGDTIVGVNDRRVWRFEDAAQYVIVSGSKPLTVTVRRPGVDEPLVLPTDGASVSALYDPSSGRPGLGLELPLGLRLEFVMALSGGDSALRPGDRLLAIDGERLDPTTIGQQALRQLAPKAGTVVAFTVLRDGQELVVNARYAGDAGNGLLGSAVGLPLWVMKVVAGSAAEAAGVRAGDRLVSLDGRPLAGRADFMSRIRGSLDARRPIALGLQRDRQDLTLTLTGKDVDGLQYLGLMPYEQTGGILPDLPPAADGSSPLAAAGLLAGDALLPRPESATGSQLAFAVYRGGTQLDLPLSEPARVALALSKPPSWLLRMFGVRTPPSPLERLTGAEVVSTGEGAGAGGPGLLAIRRQDGHADSVDLRTLQEAGWRAFLAPLAPGDRILDLIPTASGGWSLQAVRSATAMPIAMVTPAPLGSTFAFGPEERTFDPGSFTNRLAIVNDNTWNSVVLAPVVLLRMFQKPEQGGVDPNKTLTGPIGIFTELKARVERWGASSYFKFIALIGFNLFFVNLLPIPITDGGQLVFLGVEKLMGRPLPTSLRMGLAYAGVVLVVALMLYVIGLDIMRLLPF